MTRPHRRLGALAAALCLLAGLALVGVLDPAPAGAYPNANVDFAGHGWGHGRGMGQWGALGYAVQQGWSYSQILDHYYANTTMGSLPGGDDGYAMSVRIVDRDGTDTIVGGNVIVDPDPSPHGGVLVRRTGAGTYDVYYGDGCGGPWTLAQPGRGGPVGMRPASGKLTLCLSNGTRDVWGTVRADEYSGSQVTVNDLPMGLYLQGVVPRESPASWGSLSNGMSALRAQAVAARSYGAAENRYGSVAKTCDTTSCQVYGGASQTINGSTSTEDGRTNQAVADTAGQVRMLNGGVARTEFSASTGGWTAGGTFPAVEDQGDAYPSNPNHDWTTSIPASLIESKYAKGTLQRVDITQRNGLGADGGRVVSLDLVFTGGTVTLSGDSFRSAFSSYLKSDWFSVVHQASFPYHVVTAAGDVYAIGGAQFHGSMATIGVRTTVRDIAEGPGGGYWLLGADGGVFSFDVPFHGSMGGQRLNRGVVGIEPTAGHDGYWLVAGDGGIFSFDAPFYGSTGDMRLNAPVVGMKPNRAGSGYWLVATDGGIFTFGNAPFLGSTGDIRLNRPMFAMAPTPSGNGYWLVAQDGGIFSFGDARFEGSLPGIGVNETAVEMLPSPTGNGYLIVTAQGHVYGFGDATSAGGPADYGASSPSVGAGVPVP